MVPDLLLLPAIKKKPRELAGLELNGEYEKGRPG